MEGLLYREEMAQIEQLFHEAFDLASKRIFFPVRHHSPACSFQLKKVINAYKPDLILIEGPVNSADVQKYIEHKDSLAPMCIYYSYADKKGALGKDDGKYTCYYPFLDYSPELIALRMGREKGIRCAFIDLPYHDFLANCREGQRDKDEGKQSYHDDYLLSRSRFIKRLCETEGCRHFGELWEKLYETDGLQLEPDVFIKNMLAFCYYSRIDYTEEMLKEDGCLAREKFMAYNIRKLSEGADRTLVVTGGFHTSGMIELLKQSSLDIKDIRRVDASTGAAYAMAYSFEESDQLSGYASGMPYPAFYQEVWDNICKGLDEPYKRAILQFITRCGKAIRKSDSLSTADEIEAFNMVCGLKELRQKQQPGVYELQDAIRSAFTKGEFNFYDRTMSDALRKLLTGERTGKLCADAETPPLVKDFRDKLKLFRLKSGITSEQEQVLDIFKNPKHREISKFFHIMNFLGTGFCLLAKGPDFAARKNTNLIRESWKYKWSTIVESRLIELSVHGGTLSEAACSLIAQKFRDSSGQAGTVVVLLIQAAVMGLNTVTNEILPGISEVISMDGDFRSVADCTWNLGFLHGTGRLLDIEHEGVVSKLIRQSFHKASYLAASLYATRYEEEENIVAKLKDLYFICCREEFELDREVFETALADNSSRSDCNSCIDGACTGLLLGLGRIERSAAVSKAEGYLFGTGEKLFDSVGFLKGLFSTARDIIYFDETFIKGIDRCIRELNYEDFMRLIPELRMAFSYFTPGEIGDITKRVAELYGVKSDVMVSSEVVEEAEIQFGHELDRIALNALKKWGLANDNGC